MKTTLTSLFKKVKESGMIAENYFSRNIKGILFKKLSFAVFFSAFIFLNNPSFYSQVISGGGAHSLFLCINGKPMACGNNYHGQLGVGTTTSSYTTPVLITSLSGITAIAAGYSHSVFLKNDGTVWACGSNSNGQLGDGSPYSRNTPVQIPLFGIVAIAAGDYHSLFLKNDGTVWACGSNSIGQLGDGTTTDRYAPVQIPSLSGITAIAAGKGHSVFLKNDGTVWACGEGIASGLGISNNTNTPVQVSSLTGIIAVAAGTQHNLFLKNDGTVWALGSNGLGQLGVGNIPYSYTPVQIPSLSGITAIAAGYYHSLFLRNDGTVWACGFNPYGQLGDGTTTYRYAPVQIPLSGIVAIAAGYSHSLFLKNDGTVWACGLNSGGQLGDGTTTNKTTPVQVTGLCTVVTNIEDENLSSENNISLYPNPFTTQITLRSEKYLNNASIYIYNALGQMVKQMNNISGQNFILLNDNLTTGIYHLLLIEDNKIIKTEKLVLE